MKLIVGLGNPGVKYQATRHNLGFRVTDRIAQGISLKEQARYHGAWGTIEMDNQTVMLLKPNTYMNDSGRSVAAVLRHKTVALEDVLVIHDDLDLLPGKIRLKAGGGDGGHNGLKSISALIGRDYHRLRIGIGHPGNREEVTPWVLGSFVPADLAPVDNAIERAADAARCWCVEGLDLTMRRYNQ